jgi:hypothetical protein
VKTKQIRRNKNKTQKSKTHFEQVPLAVVKRVAAGDVSKNGKAGSDRSSVEPASAKRGGVPARSTP